MLRVGLTGGIGSGKSAVASMLAARGAVVCDADALAREVVAPGTEGLAELVATFGRGILTVDGALDRPALGRIAFADDGARAKLNAITHPRIGALTAERYQQAEQAGTHVWVHDVPLLTENGLAGAFDVIVVVEAPLELRLQRLETRGLPEVDARSRIATQATDAQRREIATYVIDNSGDLQHLEAEVDRVWRAITES